MRIYSALAVLVLLFSVSCSNNGQEEKHFDLVTEIDAVPVSISEILNPNNVIKLKDYIVLQNAVDAAVDVYYVYSRVRNWSFCIHLLTMAVDRRNI